MTLRIEDGFLVCACGNSFSNGFDKDGTPVERPKWGGHYVCASLIKGEEHGCGSVYPFSDDMSEATPKMKVDPHVFLKNLKRQKVVEKIEALFKKASNEAATEAEASAFFNQARRLMEQYQIDEGVLNQKPEEINACLIDIGAQFINTPQYQIILFDAMCTLFNGRIFIMSEMNEHGIVVKRRKMFVLPDVAPVAQLTFPYFLETIENFLRKRKKSDPNLVSGIRKSASYRTGVAYAINVTTKALKKADYGNALTGDQSQALVALSDTVINNTLEKLGYKVEDKAGPARKVNKNIDITSFYAGVNDGRQVDVRGVRKKVE
jgi:hypothetical protein